MAGRNNPVRRKGYVHHPSEATTARRRASAWGGHVTRRDYEVLAVAFNFGSGEDMKAFADEQQAKCDN